ncbi:hypothetical protein N825_01135 [Skermanella stibiiresistens SB22]|uniref:Flippase-like domain-containing protein n=1 Tax=Skermanella stibiiresistens SB22 TaxID=1385369 RepID=W9HDQ1_9PROT|nr:lysylphosphatidylglycerol synthase transmembrane domain-containing protein [Skermanella stibiiresistens]EWY42827.1 hypothetical protein N825_01135 [Skermanella stibiiresistens SB22]
MRRLLANKWFALVNSLAIFGLLFWWMASHLDFGAMVAVWGRLDPVWFSTVIGVMGLVVLAATLRLQGLVEHVGGRPVDFVALARISFVSLFIAHGAPISALSDVARVAMVKLRFDLPVGDAIRVVIYDRIVGALGIVFSGLVVSMALPVVDIDSDLLTYQTLLWAGGICAFLLLVWAGRAKLQVPWRPVAAVLDGIAGLGNLLGHAGFLVPQAAIALMFTGCIGLVLWLIAVSMNVPADPIVLFVFTPLIVFVNNIPFLYLGWGGREVVVVATLGAIGGMPTPEALAISITYGFVVMLSALPGAVLWLLRPTFRKLTAVTAAGIGQTP